MAHDDVTRHPSPVHDEKRRIIEALRDDTRTLDDVGRARMERRIIEALRQGDAPAAAPARVSLRAVRRTAWAASVLAAALTGAWAMNWWGHPAGLETAYFEVAIGELAVQSGMLQEGQTLESRQQGLGHVSMGNTRFDLDRRTRLRFDRLRADALELVLAKGAVDVAFHPSEKQHLRLATHVADVDVVGTVFRVQVDQDQATHVLVMEGVVRVTARADGQTLLVHAGEEVRVQGMGGPTLDPPVSIRRVLRTSEAGTSEAGTPEMGETDTGTAEAALLQAETSSPQGPTQERSQVEPGTHGPRVTTLDPARELEQARLLLHEGKHALARRRLHQVSRAHVPAQVRAEGLTLLAESYAVQGAFDQAAAAYRRAAFVGRGTASGDNAIFALARLLERDGRAEAATEAYQRYLKEAPRGALAGQAQRAMCRLGDTAACTAP